MKFLTLSFLLLNIAVAQVPDWLIVHGEQRTRYETSDTRYRPGESGGDQQLAFRTRLQMGAKYKQFWLYSEIQDTRAGLTDEGSTVNTQHVTLTRLQQGHAGYRFENVSRAKLKVSVEAGRFSRDFGGRRLIGRNNFRNATNAFDGVIGKVENDAQSWSLHLFDLRHVTYTYPEAKFDRRYRDARLKGAFFTERINRSLSFDAYVLNMNDGDAFPEEGRRRFASFGLRAFGSRGPWNYESETVWQRGHLGLKTHRAWMQDMQAGYTWDAPLHPKASLLYVYASGDRDPGDGENNAFDSLYGPRRFEFGPTGTWGIFARSNLNSPAAQILIRSAVRWDFSATHRLLMLAQPRDQWRGVGLADPSGRSGSYVGQHTEYRMRYRWRANFELDTGYVVFREGSFVRAQGKRDAAGWGRFFFAASEWRF